MQGRVLDKVLHILYRAGLAIFLEGLPHNAELYIDQAEINILSFQSEQNWN